MKKFSELNSLEKKARRSEGTMNCGKCPNHKNGICSMMEACSYIYMTAFKRGYNQRKKEDNVKRKEVLH